MSPDHQSEGGVPAVIPARRSWLSRRLHRFSGNGFSTQVYLVALVIALIGPGLLFTSILLMLAWFKDVYLEPKFLAPKKLANEKELAGMLSCQSRQ